MSGGKFRSLGLDLDVIRLVYSTDCIKRLLMRRRPKGERVVLRSFFAEESGVKLEIGVQTFDNGGALCAVRLLLD